MNATRRALAAFLGLLALAALAGCGLGEPEQRRFTARFDRAIGVYVNSDVRVLGVKIGRVVEIVPEGDDVRVEMEYDPDVKVPADASAVLVAPSIVSDRYVQLTPVWRSGPTLPDGAELGADRTAVPVELDAIYQSLDDLNRALGPDGANADGALSDLVATGAANLEGNGALLNETLTQLAGAVGTLSDGRSDLFGTITNLQTLTTTLARSDDVVRRFHADLADVASQLADQREDLAAAVKALSVALGDVATFVRANAADLTGTVDDLTDVTSVLVKQKRALEEFLDNAAVALGNLQLAYNPSSGTLDTRDNNVANIEGNPLSVLCNLLITVGEGDRCDDLPGAGVRAGSVTGPVLVGSDRTLGGLLEEGR